MRVGPAPYSCQTSSASVGMRHAEVVVLGDDDLSGIGPAGRAGRVAAHLEGAERLLQRVVTQEAPDEGVTELEEQLDGLDGLDGPDDAGQHAQDTGLRTR